MKYYISIIKNHEGYSVSCPWLPGCHSQGETEKEAIANIKIAIKEYLEAVRDLAAEKNQREVEVKL